MVELTPRSYRILLQVLQEVEIVDTSLCNRYSRWQDVVDAIETAKAQDQAKADKSLLGMRARLRNSGPEIAVLDSLTAMVPDQNGLSVLRGGLTTLFKVGRYLFHFANIDLAHLTLTLDPCLSTVGFIAVRHPGTDTQSVRRDPYEAHRGRSSF
jgi:hypothetical protein